ncbi:MAG: YtxH domain-containing protein [Chloroflexota bacterium]|nr:YtxH domain-containing protein [Chloroflexota bacterium]
MNAIKDSIKDSIKDMKLDDVLDDLRSQATKRIDEFISEGRKQARNAGGGHDDTALFSAFTLGILVGAIVGAAVALLITPFSGRQARAKLSEQVDKIRSDNVSWDATSGSGNGKPASSYEPSYTSPKPIS